MKEYFTLNIACINLLYMKMLLENIIGHVVTIIRFIRTITALAAFVSEA